MAHQYTHPTASRQPPGVVSTSMGPLIEYGPDDDRVYKQRYFALKNLVYSLEDENNMLALKLAQITTRCRNMEISRRRAENDPSFIHIPLAIQGLQQGQQGLQQGVHLDEYPKSGDQEHGKEKGVENDPLGQDWVDAGEKDTTPVGKTTEGKKRGTKSVKLEQPTFDPPQTFPYIGAKTPIVITPSTTLNSKRDTNRNRDRGGRQRGDSIGSDVGAMDIDDY